jgi:hypothetical protein
MGDDAEQDPVYRQDVAQTADRMSYQAALLENR